ncbi:hypothetical protein D3C78_1878130 [compost metagenome]
MHAGGAEHLDIVPEADPDACIGADHLHLEERIVDEKANRIGNQHRQEQGGRRHHQHGKATF